MAEAYPESQMSFEERAISILLLAPNWQFDTYGLSTVNKSLVNNLRLVVPEGKTIKITCAIVEEEKNINDDERDSAEAFKVNLEGAKQPRGPREIPDIKWSDRATTKCSILLSATPRIWQTVV